MSFEDKIKQEAKKDTPKDAYDVYNEYKDTVDNINQKTYNWFTKYWEQIVSLIIAFFLIGIQQFAQPQFDPLFFLQPKFWYEFIPYVMAIWVVIISTLTSNMRWLEDTEKTFLLTKQSIQTHVDKDKESPYIYKGAKIVDTERKISAWKSHVSKRIDKKRKKYRIPTIASLREFLDGDDTILTKKIKTANRGKIRRIRASFEELFSYLTDDYIEKYIDTIEIKYNQVNETVLVSGLLPTNNKTQESNFREDTSKVIFTEFGLGFIISSLFSGIILALDLVQKGADVTTWIVFIFKAFMLYTYYFRASARSRTVFQRTRLKALQERDSMLSHIERIVKKEKEIKA
jgi:hypothetical protein